MPPEYLPGRSVNDDNPYPVKISGPLPGEAIGAVTGLSSISVAVPGITAGAYAIGQSIGGKLDFTNVARENGAGGFIQAIAIESKVANAFAADLVIFDIDPAATEIANKAAFTLNVADFSAVCCVIPIVPADWTALGGPSFAQKTGVNAIFRAAGGARSLFGYLIARDALLNPTTVSDLNIVIKAIQD